MMTGFLSYAGPFNQEFRSRLLSNWKKELADRKVSYSADLHITNALVDAPTIGEWNLQGTDILSNQPLCLYSIRVSYLTA